MLDTDINKSLALRHVLCVISSETTQNCLLNQSFSSQRQTFAHDTIVIAHAMVVHIFVYQIGLQMGMTDAIILDLLNKIHQPVLNKKCT